MQTAKFYKFFRNNKEDDFRRKEHKTKDKFSMYLVVDTCPYPVMLSARFHALLFGSIGYYHSDYKY